MHGQKSSATGDQNTKLLHTQILLNNIPRYLHACLTHVDCNNFNDKDDVAWIVFNNDSTIFSCMWLAKSNDDIT